MCNIEISCGKGLLVPAQLQTWRPTLFRYLLMFSQHVKIKCQLDATEVFIADLIACCSILQTEHITVSSAPDQQLENHSTKYHRQQPLYNTLELLMMGIVVPETC